MTEKIHHYLFMGGESTNDFNQQMFMLGQQPTNWVSKGMRLRRDATIFFKENESARLFIVAELEKVHFNFNRFYRWELQDAINEILSNNQDRYLPDFDTYYLLMHLSLENVLKGIWLDKFPENIGFVKLPNALNTHDLIRLAGDVELELSAQQKTLLSKIAELFLGYSRYPIKQRSKKAVDPRDLEFGERPFDAVCVGCLENPYAKDKEILEALFAESLQGRIELVFQHGHELMISTFDIEKQQESIQSQESENE